jgi:hypothetical protein
MKIVYQAQARARNEKEETSKNKEEKISEFEN